MEGHRLARAVAKAPLPVERSSLTEASNRATGKRAPASHASASVLRGHQRSARSC